MRLHKACEPRQDCPHCAPQAVCRMHAIADAYRFEALYHGALQRLDEAGDGKQSVA